MTTMSRCCTLLLMLAGCLVPTNDVELGAQSGGGSTGGGGSNGDCGVTVDGHGPTPPPAEIPAVSVTFTAAGLQADSPVFDWATFAVFGTATSGGEMALSFESVTVHVPVNAGDTGETVGDRLMRCAVVPGYRFEDVSDSESSTISVRRADSAVFARFLITNRGTSTLFVYAGTELAYWLSIALAPGGPSLQLTPDDKPVCGNGLPPGLPPLNVVNPGDDVDFYWDGTHYSNQGNCWQREVLDGGLLYLDACGFKSAGATGPYSRPDGGADVICTHWDAILEQHQDLSADKTW
jgi:hypothetical protein